MLYGSIEKVIERAELYAIYNVAIITREKSAGHLDNNRAGNYA